MNRKRSAKQGRGSPVAKPARRRSLEDELPSALDGLTRRERIVLLCLDELQRARGGRSVPTAQLYGRVLEEVELSVAELQQFLQRLIGTGIR